MTSWRLGVNTCFAVKRWPQPREWARVVRDELGLNLVQHSLDLVDILAPDLAKAEAEAVREACAEFGLTLDSTFTGLAAYSSNMLLDPRDEVRQLWEKWLCGAMDFTAAAGGQFTGGHVGAFSVREWRSPEKRVARWRGLRQALSRLALRAKSFGLAGIYVENLAASREPSTIDQMEELLQEGDAERVPIVLCLDVGHQCVAGTSGPDRDPYAWMEHFGPRLGCVHVQQSDADSDHHWPFTAQYNSRGRIDGPRVLDVLEASGAHEVKLILEVIPPFEQDDEHVLQDLVGSVEYWSKVMGGLSSAASPHTPALGTNLHGHGCAGHSAWPGRPQ